VPPPPQVKVINFARLKPGQVIETDKNTIVRLAMPDGGSINLGPESRFTVDPVEPDSEVHGVFGRFRALVLCHDQWQLHTQCPFSKFSTPTAVMAVRGTEFTVDTNEQRTIVRVFHGLLAVSDLAGRKTVQVATNQETVVPKDGVPSDPQPFDPKAVDRWWELRSGFPYYGPVLGALSAFTLLIVLPQIWRRRKAHMPPPPAAPSATAHG
jgi:ferric-dicitrate binding protein FerR (iron transport regulator)